MTEDELVAAVLEEIHNRRPYASFFAASTRETGEWGVALTFAEAAQAEPGYPFGEPENRGRGNDPPDCEMVDAEGKRIAVEVTELVDAKAVAAAARGVANQWAVWNVEKVRSAIQRRLDAKDGRPLKGGRYDEYLVLVHCDEPGLAYDLAESAVVGHSFAPVATIDRAYLLLSYDPDRKQYPHLRLRFAAT